MGMRMMSKESNGMIYHRAECRYARNIKKKNRMQMTWEEAEWKGYRPCKCCDGMQFLFHQNEGNIEAFARKNNMDIDLKDNKIYVRTNVGCWKIVYKIGMQKFILLHRNYVNGRIDLEDAEKAPYHRQNGMRESGSIMKYLGYIKGHDEFKERMPADYRQLPQDSKQQKARYKSAKKREDRRSARRIDSLFAMIERKEGIRNLSFC